jgi:hypothetical protein
MGIQLVLVAWLTSIVVFGLGFGLGVLLASLVEAFDPDEPLALFRVAARRLRALRSRTSDRADQGIGAPPRANPQS